MGQLRKPFQGISNIIRFNWHFYLIAFATLLAIYGVSDLLDKPYNIILYWIVCLIMISITVSLVISLYVYDLSGLYKLEWLSELNIEPGNKLININAGFDESSHLIRAKYPMTDLTVYDFYNPYKHTEISIKRARKAYPPFKDTQQVSTVALPANDSSIDNIFIMLAAHEIRDTNERNLFCAELYRVLKDTGKIVITEHLRDVPNFIAYNIGFFHFMSRSSWYATFRSSGFRIYKELNTTPFITNFILEKNGVVR